MTLDIDALVKLEEVAGLEAFLTACRRDLDAHRQHVKAEEWELFADSEDATTLRHRFLDDPYTRRGFEKPRGYAGDAVLLDYIYGTAPLPEATSRRGQLIYRWMFRESKAFKAVRDRRKLLAKRIDHTIQRRPNARILALAAGHLREFALCNFDRAAWTGELIALDQDAASLAVIAHTFPTAQVVTERRQIAALLSASLDLGKFDLIYAAGLFDYLDDINAQALIDWCKNSLAYNGSLLVANFTQCEERGFMEAIMHWRLIYRSREELKRLAAAPHESTFSDSHNIISYAETTLR